jgi:dipeptidyl aminopeptidase/acylaminoacyl peptidase
LSTPSPYGSWKSPITPDAIVAGGIGIVEPSFAGGSLYWRESYPLQGGRMTVMRRTVDGVISELTPDHYARTRVHEYGGGVYCVHGETVYFSHFPDQRLYRVDPRRAPIPITPEPAFPQGSRYADGIVTPDGKWIICVRELHHADREADNEIVILPTDRSGEPRVLCSGRNFYSNPRLSPDGTRLSWLCWDHPNMPWDGSEVWVANLDTGRAISNPRRVAGGPAESIFQPEWSPEGLLHYVSDRTDWWNLYADQAGQMQPLYPKDAEFGQPQWVFGMSDYAFLSDGRIACVYRQHGIEHLAILHPDGRLKDIQTPYTAYGGSLVSDGDRRLAFTGAAPDLHYELVIMDVETRRTEVIKHTRETEIEPGYYSTPRSIEFPTEHNRTAHALFYPPANKDFSAVAGEKPPLRVLSHGGPTAAAGSELNLEIQYWSSRGIAVVDVNYGGSSGYGRPYRQRLTGQWGLVDVQDCASAAKYLIEQGEVDGERLIIKGGSAGGYTTLCAITFTDVFRAGASYYGIGDLETMATDTHKFESRYLDGLIGKYPEDKQTYIERSPIHYADQIACPVILFQGLDDRVVPPNQAQDMADTLKFKELPHALLMFEGEGHGFRKAENIKRCLEAELYFYSQIFSFPLAEAVEPVQIENW